MDINLKFKPTIITDVLEWDYTEVFPSGHFGVVNACQPCKQFRKARKTKPRDLNSAAHLFLRTLKPSKITGPKKTSSPLTDKNKTAMFLK